MNTNITILGSTHEFLPDKNCYMVSAVFESNDKVYETSQFKISIEEMYDLAVLDKDTIDEMLFEIGYDIKFDFIGLERMHELKKKIPNIKKYIRKYSIEQVLK